jgi:hypothetical protein
LFSPIDENSVRAHNFSGHFLEKRATLSPLNDQVQLTLNESPVNTLKKFATGSVGTVYQVTSNGGWVSKGNVNKGPAVVKTLTGGGKLSNNQPQILMAVRHFPAF